MTISISQTVQSKEMGKTLISIGTHCLSFSISGPPRAPHEPLVVIIPGSGDVVSSYVAVEPLVAQFAQIFLYDRSGLGNSQQGPNPPLAVTSAIELHKLLQATKQQPPFLLAAHSYGGIIAREFFHLFPDEVGGMVLFDTATERNLEYFQVPDPNIAAVLGNLKMARVTGLRADAKLTRDQWRQRAIDMARGDDTAQAEADGDAVVEVCRALAEKKQFDRQAMGDKPLSIIRCNSARDYERIYAAGVEAGNGTEAQQRAFRRTLDRWESATQDLSNDQLRLSSRTHFVHLPECGHNVQLVRPDVVAEEIKWVLDQMLGGKDAHML
jgi:pimeloyl-ACP methyl ester carboxylesterase